LAILVAVGRAGFGWAFAAVFLADCAFSFAANSALTFWAMASVAARRRVLVKGSRGVHLERAIEALLNGRAVQ
jgi:UDP-N-acetylmuramyl pentapeptide synthase